MEHATDDAHPLPSAQEDRPCHGLDDLFEAQVARRPEATALSFGDDTLTYRELSSRANRLARCLQKRGVGPDVLVGICLERSVEMALSVLAVLKAGGACVPLDPSYPRERLAFTLGDARPPLVLTTTGLLGRLPPSPAALLILDTEREALARESSERPAPRAAGQDAAYVIYTSGSTGTPKGVVMVTRSLASLVAWQVGDSRLGPGARTIQFSSLGFAISFQEILSTWCSGGTLVLVSEEVRRDPVRLLRFLADESIERLFVPFVALQQLAETALARELVPACLREIVTAGEQLRITRQVAGLMARLGRCTLQNQYGATESHIVTAFTLCGPSEAWPTLPPIGRPLPGARVTILGPDLQPAPTGVAGEICIGGERLARGYLGRPDLTAERFLPDPFRGEAGARLYRTGDAGRLLPDGNIEFLGRLDRQVKIRGYRVEPGEVEAALCEHPGVRQAIVVARGEPDGRHLLAYVVPAEGQGVDAGALRRFLEGKLPDYMVPSRFITLDALPLTPTGKVDRAALPVPDSARPELGVPFVAPRTPLERTLAGIWSEALEISPIGVRDPFLDLGGNSLKAMRLAARVRSAFCVDLPLATLFAAPTIEAQVVSLTEALARRTEPADAYRIRNEIKGVPRGQGAGEEPR